MLQNDQLSNRSRGATSSTKLPYLQPNKLMPYPSSPHSHRNSPKNHFKQFNLRTNHCSIPRYQPEQDQNLAYFFDKPYNRKIMEELRQVDLKRHHRREHKTQKQGRNSLDNKDSRNNQQILKGDRNNQVISKGDFMKYLQKMKEKLQKTKSLSQS